MREMGGKVANYDLRRTVSVVNARYTNDASGSRGREVPSTSLIAGHRI